MNWKHRKSELRSGTRNVFPRTVISTKRSYGRKTSDESIAFAAASLCVCSMALTLSQRRTASNYENHESVQVANGHRVCATQPLESKGTRWPRCEPGCGIRLPTMLATIPTTCKCPERCQRESATKKAPPR